MPLLTWSDSLSVNVPDLDAQHQRLIGQINQLHDAMTKGRGQSVLRPLLANVVQYTLLHFGVEEKYMQQIKFPLYNEHRAEHAKLGKTVQDLKQRYEAGQTMLTLEVMSFLSDWLTNHIKGSDQKYAPRSAPTAAR